jgi:hypothetical protein
LVPTETPTATEVPSATSKPYRKPVDPPTATAVPPTRVPNTPRPTESGFVTPTR